MNPTDQITFALADDDLEPETKDSLVAPSTARSGRRSECKGVGRFPAHYKKDI